MSADLLAPVAERLTAPGDGAHRPPAAVLGVAEGDGTHVAASGLADLDRREPVTVSHAFDLASVSKVLTTLTVRRMIDSGALSEDTELGAILGRRSGVAAGATLDDLLRHRSGLAEWRPLYLEPGFSADPVATALAQPARYARGEGRQYSDLGMQALGAVVAEVGGAGLAQTVREVLLEPLGITTITPGAPAPGAPVASGPDGDAIEREMVRSGVPYPVSADGDGFAWRTHTLRGEVADGNAFHAFGGVAGHAGWFSDAAGLLRIAEVIADPRAHGFAAATERAFATALDDGQGQGLQQFRLRWRGRERLFLGHPGFTGTFVAAAPAVDGMPAVRTVLLTNRLHGRPAPGRDRLTATDALWREAIASAEALLHPTPTGVAP